LLLIINFMKYTSKSVLFTYLIENDQGKFVLSIADSRDLDEATIMTPFYETDTSFKWNELYY